MEDEPLGLESFTDADVLPPLKGWTLLGWGVLSSSVLVGLGLAIALPVQVRVRSPGVIRPEQAIQVVQAGMDGTIARIEVAENDRVTAGQAIAFLQDPNLPRLERTYAEAYTVWKTTQTEREVLTAQLNALQYAIVSEAADLDAPALPDSPDDALEAALARLVAHRPAQGNQRLADYRHLQQALADNQQHLQHQQETLAVLTQERRQRQLVAPADGTVFQLNLHNPGQQVQQGTVVARIIPVHSDFVVQAEVSPRDIGQVEVGQTAHIRVAAYPYPEYGGLTGQVVAIAPDVRPCEQVDCPSATTYQVTLHLEAKGLQRGDRTYPLQPGMDVTVDIVSRQEQVLTLLWHKLSLTLAP